MVPLRCSSREKAIIRSRLKALRKDTVRLGKVPVTATKAKQLDRAEALLQTVDTDPKAQQASFRPSARCFRTSRRMRMTEPGTCSSLDEIKLLVNLSRPVGITATPGHGGAASLSTLSIIDSGGVADLGDSILSGIRRLMNLTTYYQMKDRAGEVEERRCSDDCQVAQAVPAAANTSSGA